MLREHDALRSYPPGWDRRTVIRTIRNRISAAPRGEEFFDGARTSGYGGYVDDGRWRPVAKDLFADYGLGVPEGKQGLEGPGAVLQVQCEKGFLLRELSRLGCRVAGTETSGFAADCCSGLDVVIAHPRELPFADGEFDLALAIGVVYALTLPDALECLRELQRVTAPRGRAFVTLAAYDTGDDEGRRAMQDWSLLGTLLLTRGEWSEVMAAAGYEGDYKFITARSLGLL